MNKTNLVIALVAVTAIAGGGLLATSGLFTKPAEQRQEIGELANTGPSGPSGAQVTRRSGDSRVAVPAGTDAEAPTATLRQCTAKHSAGSGQGIWYSCAALDELPNGTTVTMLCWQDGDVPVKEDGTSFTAPGWDSPRWFQVRSHGGKHPGWIGYLYSGTIPVAEQVITPWCGDHAWKQVGAPEWQRDLVFAVTGTCTTGGGTLTARSANFTADEPYDLTVTGPSGAVVPTTTKAVVNKDGSIPFTWDCQGDPPGLYTARVLDRASGREVTDAHFVVGNDITTAPPPPPAADVVVTVLNQTTRGPSEMDDDPKPAYLSSETRGFCKDRGCAVPNTDLRKGDRLKVVCQTTGDELTNTNRSDPSDDTNPGRATSAVWYRGVWPDGRQGYISVVWLVAGDRGLALPRC